MSGPATVASGACEGAAGGAVTTVTGGSAGGGAGRATGAFGAALSVDEAFAKMNPSTTMKGARTPAMIQGEGDAAKRFFTDHDVASLERASSSMNDGCTSSS